MKLAVGPALTVAFGRRLRGGLRAEVEGNLRLNRITGETGFGDEGDVTGTETKYGVMDNALYDFGTASVTPYVGGGVGAIAVPAQTEGSVAYQAIVGVAWTIRRVPGLAATGEYLFLGLAGTRTFTGTATIAGVGSVALTDRSGDDNNHSLLVGIRYAFGG